MILKCKQCGKDFSNYTKINGKSKHLKNRTRCFDCVPFRKSIYSTPSEPLICIKCNKKFDRYIEVDGIRKSVKNRKYCFECHPRYSKRTDEEKAVMNREKQRKYATKVKNKFGKFPSNMRKEEKKRSAINLVGGCQFCGYNRCLRNLVFHHTKNKNMALSAREMTFSMEKLKPELKKCVVACHNCHGEIHDNIISDDVVEKNNKIFSDLVDAL